MNRASDLMGLLLNRSFCEVSPEAHFREYKNDLGIVQRLKEERRLEVHTGCVNTIAWSTGGDYILSGSDDHYLCVTNPFENKVKHKIKTSHASNIFSAKYLPQTGDSQVVSCSASGRIIHTDLQRPEQTAANIFDCIRDSVYEVQTVPNDPNSFLICSHDKTVRWYDLRVKQKCPRNDFSGGSCRSDILLTTDYPVTALAVNPRSSWQFAIGRSDSIVSVFDRRKLGTQSLGHEHPDAVNSLITQFAYNNVETRNRITSLSYNNMGDNLLVSYSWDSIYLFDLNEVRSEQEQKKMQMEADESTDDDSDIQSRRGFKRHFNISEYEIPQMMRSSSLLTNRAPFHFGIRDHLSYVEVDSYTLSDRNSEPRNSNNWPAFQQVIDADNIIQYPRARYFLRTQSSSNNNGDDNEEDSNNERNGYDDDESEEMDSLQSRSSHGSHHSVITPSSPGDNEPRRLSRSLRRNREFSYRLKRNSNKSRVTHYTSNFKKFSGHRNQKTVIKEANFWGDNFIVSGSDCGHVFFWSIHDQKPVALFKADRSVVNCVQPHPTAPILAASGIENDIKIFSPIANENQFSKKVADAVISNNKKTSSSFDGPLHSRIVLHFYAALNRDRLNEEQRTSRDSNIIRGFREIREHLNDEDPFY